MAANELAVLTALRALRNTKPDALRAIIESVFEERRDDLKGDKGDPGERGPVGPKGDRGPRGEVGPVGPQGDPGPKGDKGESGADGATGPAGADGERGARGEPGPQGAKGDTGAQGPRGERGPQGEAGQQGPRGQTGPRGEAGPQGERGPSGPTGRQGPTGEQGPRGFVGEQGIQGEPGVSIDSARIVEGDLILSLTDGTEINAGRVQGKDTTKTFITRKGITRDKKDVAVVTSDYTLSRHETVILADAQAGEIALTLPSASGNRGRSWRIKRTSENSNDVVVNPLSGDTIDGEAELRLNVAYYSVDLVSDGSNWYIL